MKKLILLIYLLVTLATYASFRVAPQVQKINLNRPGTRKIYLKNESDKLKKIKIYSRRPVNQENQELYMGDWIIVYPKIVYLKPNSKKVVRMSARPPQGLADGEYRSHLVFEELPLERHIDEKTTEGGVQIGVDMVHILVSTVYGYSGNLKYDGVFDDFKVVTDENKTYLLSKVINTGTTALDIVYKIAYYRGEKKLKDEEVLVGKVMRENDSNTLTELSEISDEANKMMIGQYYRVQRDAKKIQEGEEEYEEFKLGEKIIPINRITKKEYFKTIKAKKVVVEKKEPEVSEEEIIDEN